LNDLIEELSDHDYTPTRWAIKEAAYKALQPDFSPSWKELWLEVEDPKPKRPIMRFHSKQITRAGQDNIRVRVSLSHDKDYVVAVAHSVAIQQ
jgi:phosphopantetheinyl transferase (holo-ACP synthase)